MKVLVTGAAGFLGHRVVRRLAAASQQVVAMARQAAAVTQLRELGATPLLADLRQADLEDLLPADVDAVISLAQSSHFRDFPARASDIFEVNVRANFRLLQWAQRRSVARFLLASSGGVPSLGNSSVSPLDFYLATKLCAEALLGSFAPGFRSAIIVRPFFIYGPGQRQDMLIPRLIESVATGRPVRLQGENGLRLNPVFVDDVALALADLLQAEGPGLYDLGGPDVLNLREIADIIGRKLGRRPLFEQTPGEPAHLVGQRDAGVRFRCPSTRFEDGVALTIGHAHRE